MIIGKLIRAWRNDRNISVRLAAKIIGTSAATLNRIERGENCDAHTLAKVLLWMLGEG